MSNSNIAVIDPRPSLAVGHRPSAIVPTDMDSCYRLAKAVCIAQMAPKGLDTPEKAMIAIMHGMEVGLTPMAALQRIAVVNGRPTIWGDGAMGLVRGSGLCEYVKEWIEGTGDDRIAFCETKRRGEPESVVRKFSVADAKRAGLWGKQGPWTQYPDRMLAMRARAFDLRDVYADVLGGLYIKEEIEDAPHEEVRRVVPRPPNPHAQRALPAPTPAPETTATAEPPIDLDQGEAAAPTQRPPAPNAPTTSGTAEALRRSAFESYREAALAAQDIGALDDAWSTHITPIENELGRELYEAASQIDDTRRGMLE